MVFIWLYLISFAVLASWFVLLIVGFFNHRAMELANSIAIPVLIGSVVALTIFKWLAAREQKKVSLHG